MGEEGDGRRNNRPPVSGQFKPGQSGFPSGRPKGSRSRRNVLEDELDKKVAVTENGRRVKRRKWDVIVAQQVNKALAGDLKATQFVADQMVKYGLLVEKTDESVKLTVDETAVFDNVVRRIRAADIQTDQTRPPSNDHSNPTDPTEGEEES